jgi:hypothetical protein
VPARRVRAMQKENLRKTAVAPCTGALPEYKITKTTSLTKKNSLRLVPLH